MILERGNENKINVIRNKRTIIAEIKSQILIFEKSKRLYKNASRPSNKRNTKIIRKQATGSKTKGEMVNEIKEMVCQGVG